MSAQATARITPWDFTSAAAKTLKLNAAPVVGSKNVTGQKFSGTAAKVYFTDKIDAPHLIKLYNMINGEIYGKVGLKLHTGEPNGPNILPREMVKAFQAQVPKQLEQNNP